MTQSANRLLQEHVFGQETHVPSPPKDQPVVQPVQPTPQPSVQEKIASSIEKELEGKSPVDIPVPDTPPGGKTIMEDTEEDRLRHTVFWLGNRHNQCLVVDREKQECFFLKWKPLRQTNGRAGSWIPATLMNKKGKRSPLRMQRNESRS